MPKAVRYDDYGGVDVLQVVEVDRPVPGPGQVLVRVKAAGINPGEAKIRDGLLAERWPSTFPSGQGSDLAGVVEELGGGVTGFAVGDEVIGWTDNRASQAEFVSVEAADLTHRPRASRGRRPAGCSWWGRPRTRRSVPSPPGRVTSWWSPARPAASARSRCSWPRMRVPR